MRATMIGNKKKLALWSLYDFANSIVAMAFLFYFSQWLVIDKGMPAWWYNAALIGSSALFIATAPHISRKIDAAGHNKGKIGGLRLWTVLAVLGYALVSTLMLLDASALLITLLYGLTTYAYLTCFLYFTPMLSDLSQEGNRSLVSGIGQSANSVGQVAGVLVTLPFISGFVLFGEPGRAQALLPATIIFAVLALPMLLFYKDGTAGDSPSDQAAQGDAGRAWPSLKSMFSEVFGHKPLAVFLLAYFLFSDALLTFSNNFPLYLEEVYGVSDAVKSLLTAGILLLAAVGAMFFGKMADKHGKVRVLRLILIGWILVFVTATFAQSFAQALPVFLLAGLIFGPVWGISRALVADLAPKHLVASSYSYYVVAERFATFVGPAVWSAALLAAGESASGYRTAMLSLGLLLAASLAVLMRMRPFNGERSI
ncbi:MAG TPA: MFS transporter [Candidatus Paceibacterota bacterium]